MTLPQEPTADNDAATIDPEALSVDVSTLQADLATAEAKAAEHRDLYMRALAEMENMRKRATRDIEHAHRFALEKFSNDLISVKDTLEMGLAVGANSDSQTLLAGTDATLKLLSKAFEKAGVIELLPVAEPFNPELHEAMVTQPSTDYPPNTVLQVVQKGYQLNGRLLRPARVIVSREP
ncbi:MAG: nucleotide exchange factor GrpE [Candidatus Obscuribacterales bacterium]|nr:nucleotide exchange factor GrpE [Steroidobacteraceae bacterium]